MNLAIEMLEQQVLDLESDKKILTEEVSNLKQSVDRATDLVKRLKTKEEDEE